jgi:hypothetical protein
MLDPMKVLRTFLDAQGAGPLVDRAGLVARLIPVWLDLEGASDWAMEARKLSRMENPEWLPPVLTFVVERHGGTVNGSSRADLQTWTVNLDAATAISATTGRRQLRPQAARLDVGPIVDEVMRLVVDGLDDPRLKWSADHGTVRIAVGRYIPAVGPQQTVDGRRKRFGAKLQAAMADAGWAKTAPATFVRAQAEVG